MTAIINQEHQCRGSSYVDLQYEAKNLGWNLQGSQAAQSSLEGVSAGVCVASRAAVGRGLIHGKADLSPRVSPGRFTAAWLQIGPDTGIVVGSVYLYHSEYASIRNRKLLEHAVAVLSAYGSPWILGGDYNLPPQDLLHLFPHVLEQANAYVFATELPTHCPTAGQHRTLDYLICSSAACQWIEEVYVDYSIAAAPHRAVRIKLRAYRHNFTVECLRSPKQFPRYKPIGCSRSPVVPRGVSAADASSLEVCGYATSVESPSETWPALAHAIETELCRVIDSVDSNGLAQPAYSGRARGVRTSQMLVLPRRASASLGKVDEVAHALNWLAVRISEIAAISAKVKAGILLSDGAKRQWSAIMSKITAQKGLALIVRRVSVEWKTLLESVAYHKPGQDSEWLRRVAELAREDAVAHKKQHCEIRAESWKAHVDRQLKNGAAVTHRWIKRDSVDPVAVDTVGEGKNRSASPQAIVNQDLQMWKAVWCRPGIEGDAPWRCEVAGEELPLIRAEDISRAARSFKPVTSIGCDSIPPRAMGWISDELSGEIARFLNSVEQVGRWPPAISTSLVHLIPKPGGGRRPIGVLPTVVRLWERARKSLAQQWLRENRRPYDWATQGRSSEAAVWQCSLFDEAAKGRGLLSATTLVDLTKAFEMVKLRDIWLAARRHDFPLRLIRPALEAFSFARRLCYQGAVSAPVDTKTAILAGGGFAQLALLLVLLDPLDEIHAIFSGRSVNLCAYVDDIALHAVGTEREICSSLVQATDHLVSILEGGLDMQVSRREAWSTAGQTKTVTVASSRPLAKSLSTPMRRLGILMKTKAKHLGVEFTPGSRTREPRREKSRWALNAARRARAIRLGRGLGVHAYKTAIVPAAVYGSSIALPTLGTSRALRREVARAMGPLLGRSIVARVTVARCDPEYTIVKKAVFPWLQAVWERRIDSETMVSAWKQAHIATGLSTRPSVSAGGAASGYIAALRRVGWKSPAWDHLMTMQGTLLDLSITDPRTVMKYLTDDFDTITAAGTRLAEEVTARCDVASSTISDPSGCGYVPGESDRLFTLENAMRYDGKLVPWFAPIAAVLNSRWAKDFSPAVRASVAALAEGGWWTQERMFRTGLAADPYCRACHATEAESKLGSLWHRMCECKARAGVMASKLPTWLRCLA